MHRGVGAGGGGGGGESRSIRRSQTSRQDSFGFARHISGRSFRQLRRIRSGGSTSSSKIIKRKTKYQETIPEEEESDWCAKSNPHHIPLQHKRALAVKTLSTINSRRPPTTLANIGEDATCATTGNDKDKHRGGFLSRARSQVIEPIRTNSSKTRMDTVRVGSAGAQDEEGDVLLLQVPNGEAVEVVSLYLDDDRDSTLSQHEAENGGPPLFMSHNGDIVENAHTTVEDDHDNNSAINPNDQSGDSLEIEPPSGDKYSIGFFEDADGVESRFTLDDHSTAADEVLSTGNMTEPHTLARNPTTTSVSDYYRNLMMSHDSQASTVPVENVSPPHKDMPVSVAPDTSYSDEDDDTTVATSVQHLQHHSDTDDDDDDETRYTSYGDASSVGDGTASVFSEITTDTMTTYGTHTTYATTATDVLLLNRSWRSDLSVMTGFHKPLNMSVSDEFKDMVREVSKNPVVLAQWLNPL
ncbi:expressed unknown protein [Seminavis robusta]|uniref:Uncharacterized protein n=1 Tax=Seminavis robusta TaxID=568900 RepID=A0A9N8EQI7_9STRA|nr:expressed unknown protein [Seminavis robusta]|eukprot:Sro1787_g297540.1 n/a (468) ;mRNA; f:16031-17434